MPQNTRKEPATGKLISTISPGSWAPESKSSAGPNIRLSLDHNLRRRTPGACALKLLAHFARDVAIDLRMRAVGFGRDHRKAGVGFFADRHMQRYLAEERDAETFRLAPCATMTENIRPCAAVRAEEIAHVLDHTEYRHVHPFEHGHAAPSVDQRKILRRGDDDRASERHLLRHRELGVTGAGRHIDHHHVERAPLDLAQHLGERRDDHRPAPDHRRLLVDEEANRHDGEPVARDRLEARTADGLRPLRDREELGQGGTVDVGVEDPDLEAERAWADPGFDAGGGLPTPPLAGSDGED